MVPGLAILHPDARVEKCPDGGVAPGSPATCRWCVDLYSDYRDDRVDLTTRTAVLAHLDSCPTCRRYDRVIRTGVSVLRECEKERPGRIDRRPGISTLPDRAWAIEKLESTALGTAGSGVTTAGVAMVALVLGAFAWIPFLAPGTPEVEVAPVLAADPAPDPAPHSVRLSSPPLLPLSGPLFRPGSLPADFVVPTHLLFQAPQEISGEGVRPMVFDYGAWLTRRPPQGLAATIDPD